MHKKKSCLVLMVVCLMGSSIFSPTLWAENSSQTKAVGFGLFGGYALQFEDRYGNAPAAGLSFFFNLGKQLRVELKGTFYSSETENDPAGLSKGTLKVIPIQMSLQYRFKISRRWIPYLSGGAGYYLNKFSLENKSVWEDLGFDVSEKVNSTFGFHAGAGLDIFFNPRMALQVDARYCGFSFTGDYTITEVGSGISHSGSIDGDIKYILFSAGIIFLF